MSTIFYNEEKEYSNKMIKFVILLSEFKLESAQNLLNDLAKKNYFSHLQRLLNHLRNAELIQKQAAIHRYTIKQLNRKIGEMSSKCWHSEAGKPSEKQGQQPFQTQILRLLQGNLLDSAKKMAHSNKMNAIQDIIQQVIQYRFLKQQISAKQSSANPVQFTSLQGRSLSKISQDFLKLKDQINNHLLSRIRKYLAGQPINQLPSNLFHSDLQKQFEKLINFVRSMKNEQQNYKDEIQQKMKEFAFENTIDLKDHREIDLFTGFLDQIRFQLFAKETKTGKSIKNQSLQESSSDVKKAKIDFTRSSRVVYKKSSDNESQLFKNQAYFPQNLLQKLNQIYQALTYTLDSDQGFAKLSLGQKLDKIIEKAKQLHSQRKQENQLSIHTIFAEIIKNIPEQPQKFVRNVSEQQTRHHNKYYIKELQDKLQDYKKQNEELKLQKQKNKKHTQSMVLKFKEQDAKLNESYIEIKQTNSTTYDFQNEIEKLNGEIVKLKDELDVKCNIAKGWQQDKAKYKKQLKTWKNKYDSLEKKHLQLKIELDEQVHQVDILNRLYQERYILQQIDNKKQLTESTFIRVNQQKTKLELQNTALTQQNQRLQSEINEQARRKNQTQEIAIGSSYIYDTQQEAQILGRQSTQRQNQHINGSFIDSIRKEQVKQQAVPQFCLDKIKQLQSQVELLLTQNLKKQENIKVLNSKYLEVKQLSDKVEQQRNVLALQMDIIDIRAITHNKENVNNVHLFPPGFIFAQHDYQERQFLLDNLISNVGPIRSTRLLYRADSYNKTNFHNYIDHHRHVVIICKTIFGKLIAGYSEQAFDPKNIKRGRGMILSLWSRKTFYIKQKRAISYDDYYIIFGNSQLRVRSLQFKLFSNFGIANAYYNNEGHKVDVILGQGGQRQVDLSEYQVYGLDLWQ